MVMVFTLISETQEYLNQAVEDEKKSREEEKLRKIKEAEKAELVKNIVIKVALQGPVVQSWVSANRGLKFNPLF